MNKANITSTSYGEVFGEKIKTEGFLTGSTIIIILLSILTGLFGYYIGDSGLLRNAKLLNLNAKNATADQDTPEINYYSQSDLNKKIDSSAYDFNLYNQIIANLKDKYIDPNKISDQKLFDGSLKGLVASVGDNATVYFTADEYKDYKSSFSGKFQGIGVRLDYQNNRVVIAEVLPDTPAQKSGLQVGYIFQKISGVDVSSSNIEEVVTKVRGESGTKVQIEFFDPVKNQTIEKEVERAAVNVDSMRLIEKNKDTVILEIARFTEPTLDQWYKKWDTTVQQIITKKYKNIILDLRGNGGGYLDAAIYAANDFLDAGKPIVSEKSRIKETTNTLSKGNPKLKDKKVSILVNGGTASASEILAGALRQNNSNYKVYGVKTYGKGTVQNTWSLNNGGALKITTEYWLLPDGKKLDNENPIKPDIEVQQNVAELNVGKDNVLDVAMKDLK